MHDDFNAFFIKIHSNESSIFLFDHKEVKYHYVSDKNIMILSIDVGEKNFAYCIGDKENIYAWKKFNVIKRQNQTIVESCIEITNIFSEEKLIKLCDIVLIEQQMRCNIRAQRIGQHIWTWFSTKYPGKVVTFFPSYMKTQYFIGRNNFSAKTRKVWSVEKVREILVKRDDRRSLTIFENTHGKKDDLADAFLQLLAYVKE